MAKATMVLPNGATVTIQGDSSEVSQILGKISHLSSERTEERGAHPSARGKKPAKTRGQTKAGPTKYVLELRDENFFKSKRRSLPEIQARLEEKGHIYAQTSLSPIMVRLVRKKEIRRLKDKKGWVYVS